MRKKISQIPIEGHAIKHLKDTPPNHQGHQKQRESVTARRSLGRHGDQVMWNSGRENDIKLKTLEIRFKYGD